MLKKDSEKKPVDGCITYAGKLNGAILANTPSGTFLTSVSISLLTAANIQQPSKVQGDIEKTFEFLAHKC